MKYRTYKNTPLTVSEVGFGMWTISTGWWGQFTEGEAISLMHKAFDLGITLFDAADTYGNGLSEELIAKAFPGNRDGIVIATKIGYDFVNHGETRGRGQREIPHDFSPAALVRATDAALKRLKTDRVDLMQLHNIRMEQVTDNALWETMERLKGEGKILHYGIALGPAIGWLYEGVNCIREREIACVQHIYNMLEQHPGKAMQQAAIDAKKDTMFMIRVTHSSGMLEGHYTEDTVFPEGDHRRHRPKSWLVNGVKKWSNSVFSKIPSAPSARPRCNGCSMTRSSPPRCRTSMRRHNWSSSRRRPDSARLTADELARIDELYARHFGIEDEEPGKFKGTMELETAAA